MKHILKILIIIVFLPLAAIHAEDAQAKKAALEIIASISDDIATLVINHNSQKDPDVAKITSIKLITTLADAIACVITKIKERKEMRSVELYSDAEYDQALQLLSENLIHKIQN